MDRYPPVGRCIYCGAKKYTPDSDQPLADEHIIPLALNGDRILPQASCRACERLTGNCEQIALRGVLRGARVSLGLRSRKGHPDKLPLYAHVGGKVTKFELPVAEYPSFLMLCAPCFYPLALTDFDCPPNPQTYGYLVALSDSAKLAEDTPVFWADDPPEKAVVSDNRDGVATPALDVKRYFRMLAKIAHAFTVAELGLQSFSPLLIDIILGRADDDLSLYVGGPLLHSNEHMAGVWHAIRLHVEQFYDGPSYVVAELQLFALFGGPTVYIVTGELPMPLQEQK